jgi:GTPase SAR1 family protein
LRKLDEAGVPHCNGARVVGLYGTGGVGKTTIAQVLCNQKFGEFAGKICHMELGSRSPMALEEKLLRKLPEFYAVHKQIIRGADGNEVFILHSSIFH